MGDTEELICDEAINLSASIKYDAILSNSVFSYFRDYDYALQVLKIMYSKANYSIGIIDIHDIKKQDAFVEFRKKTVENYEEKYKELPKLFYDKKFFLDFADKYNMDIKFKKSNMKGYWNNEFVYHCFLMKN